MTKLLRFRDLRDRGIIPNWPTLKVRIARDGFPPGRMIGPNIAHGLKLKSMPGFEPGRLLVRHRAVRPRRDGGVRAHPRIRSREPT